MLYRGPRCQPLAVTPQLNIWHHLERLLDASVFLHRRSPSEGWPWSSVLYRGPRGRSLESPTPQLKIWHHLARLLDAPVPVRKVSKTRANISNEYNRCQHPMLTYSSDPRKKVSNKHRTKYISINHGEMHNLSFGSALFVKVKDGKCWNNLIFSCLRLQGKFKKKNQRINKGSKFSLPCPNFFFFKK